MFNRSWEMLSEDAHRILMVMPIFATSASKEAIEAASDVHTWDLDEGLGQLVEMSLVEVSGGLEEEQRYSVHPLVRAFAGARLGEDVEWEEDARKRWARYFLECAKNGAAQDGYSKLELEFVNILDAIFWCYSSDLRQMVMEFLKTLKDFWHAVTPDRATELEKRVANELQTRGWTCYLQNNPEKALHWFKEALHILKLSEDIEAIATVEDYQGIIAKELWLKGLWRDGE